MLNWLAPFVARWVAVVPNPVLDAIHWVGHAIAGVVYTVFGHVGRAWIEVWHAAEWLHRQADNFVYWVTLHIGHLVTHVIPHLFAQALAWYRDALAFAGRLYRDALAAVERALATARRWVDDALAWTVDHVLKPLLGDVAALWRQLVAWGYVAWYYVTHPDKLAPILIRAIITAAEDVFWDVAAPVGRFAFGIILANARRFIGLVEDIVAAVL